MRVSQVTENQLLIVISGPSGVGKDSVVRRLKQREPSLYFVVTATTRPPRKGEVDGQDYLFVSRTSFNNMVVKNEFIEHAVVYGERKGVPKNQVEAAWASGQDVVMRLDVQGASEIRNLYPDSLLIFLTTNTELELENRLLARKSETPEGLKLRVATAVREMESVDEFDYCIVNADEMLDETVDVILAIIKAERHRVQKPNVLL